VTELKQSSQAIGWFAGRLDQPAKAGSAKNFIFMLRDALPAEKTTARGTARNCFPGPVIVTSLVSEFRHWRFKLLLYIS